MTAGKPLGPQDAAAAIDAVRSGRQWPNQTLAPFWQDGALYRVGVRVEVPTWRDYCLGSDSPCCGRDWSIVRTRHTPRSVSPNSLYVKLANNSPAQPWMPLAFVDVPRDALVFAARFEAGFPLRRSIYALPHRPQCTPATPCVVSASRCVTAPARG